MVFIFKNSPGLVIIDPIGQEDIFKCLNIFTILLLSPLRKRRGPSFAQIVLPSCKNALCQVSFKFANWFLRRLFISVDVLLLFCNLPLEKDMTLPLYKFELPSLTRGPWAASITLETLCKAINTLVQSYDCIITLIWRGKNPIISFLITEWSLFVKRWVPFTQGGFMCQVSLKLAFSWTNLNPLHP